MTGEKLLNVKQAAVIIGRSKFTLYKMRGGDDSPLPYILTKDGIRYKMSDVLRYKEICEKKDVLQRN
jgi:hypothetical protein